MDRPGLLVVPVDVLAAVTAALRGIVAIEWLRANVGLVALPILSRGL
jgi:hypothetical protein